MLSTLEVDRARLSDIDARLAELERSLDALRSRAPLETDRARLADVDAEILRLEHSLVGLRAENAFVKERLDSYKYPVLTLPHEIMSEIFIHFLPIYPLCPTLVGVFSPIFLTQICGQWREIALATPALWKAVGYSEYAISLERECELVNMWLDRSGCCPLSMSLHRSELLPAIVPYLVRLEHLRLYSTATDLSPLNTPMPLLRKLDVYITGAALAVSDLVLHEVPLLHAVSLNLAAARRINLPWGQLTSLTLHDVGPSDCANILQRTPNLVHCELFIWYYSDERTVTLPCLQSLALWDAQGIDGPTRGYLDNLIVPALNSLQVSQLFLGPNPIDTLEFFIKNSGCHLREVDIDLIPGFAIDESSFREAFASIPKFTFIEW
ncbi:hypothetical protein DFH06DRAFT_1093263 [Mycena polygramma]|nr:hypothetical protein DFH06DRAFT_1093263 [Mycena polygramma]